MKKYCKIIFILNVIAISAELSAQDNYYNRENRRQEYERNADNRLKEIQNAKPMKSLTFDYSIDMSDYLKSREYQKQKDRESKEFLKKQAEQRRMEEAKLAVESSIANEKEKRVINSVEKVINPVIDRITQRGFPLYEAKIIATYYLGQFNWRDTDNLNLQLQSNSDMDLVLDAYSDFQKKYKTASYNELLNLVSKYKFLGYSSVDSLEKIMKRFPDKKDELNDLIMRYGLNYWLQTARDHYPYNWKKRSQYNNSSEDIENYSKMKNYLNTWFTTMPKELVAEMNKSAENKSFGELSSYLNERFNDTYFKRVLRLVTLNYPINHDILNSSLKKCLKKECKEDVFTIEDVEAVKKKYNTTGLQALKYLTFKENPLDFVRERFSKPIDIFYKDILQKYVDEGEPDAANYLKAINSEQSIIFKLYTDGDTSMLYTGEWQRKKPNGFGYGESVNKGNESEYEGTWKNGEKEGFGYLKEKDGFYVGEFKNDERSGKGKWTGNDGVTFEGDFKNNKANGYGVYKWANGDTYEGEVKNWQRHGKGKYTYANGVVEEGKFEKGNFLVK